MRRAMIIPMHSNMILKLSSSSSKNKKWYSSLFHFFLELKKFQIKSGISSAGRLMSLPKLPNSRKMRVHDNSAGTNIIPFTSTVKYKSRLSYFLLCVVLSGKRDRASERSKDKWIDEKFVSIYWVTSIMAHTYAVHRIHIHMDYMKLLSCVCANNFFPLALVRKQNKISQVNRLHCGVAWLLFFPAVIFKWQRNHLWNEHYHDKVIIPTIKMCTHSEDIAQEAEWKRERETDSKHINKLIKFSIPRETMNRITTGAFDQFLFV